MATEIIWTNRAKENFRDIISFLIKDSDYVAEKWVDDLEKKSSLIS